jgi:hypothetical protein
LAASQEGLSSMSERVSECLHVIGFWLLSSILINVLSFLVITSSSLSLVCFSVFACYRPLNVGST